MTYPPSYERFPDNNGSPYTGPPQYGPPPKKKNYTTLILFGALIALALVVGCLALTFDSSSDKPTTTATTAPAETSKPPIKAAPPKKPIIPQIGEGEFEVGKDVTAGKYKTAGAADSMIPLCSFSVLNNQGTYVDSGLVDGLNEQAYVTLKTGQTFKTSGCKAWIKQ
jgi:hypothetical protein